MTVIWALIIWIIIGFVWTEVLLRMVHDKVDPDKNWRKDPFVMCFITLFWPWTAFVYAKGKWS